MMPSNSLCVSNPLSYKESRAWPSNREGQESAEALLLGVQHGPFPLGLARFLARLRCWDVLEGLTRGQALQEQLPGCSFGVSVAFLWSVLMCPGEACELWVKSDSRIPLGLTQHYCAP